MNIHIKFLYTIVLTLSINLFCAASVLALTESVNLYKLQAAYVYNFAKFATWPGQGEGDFGKSITVGGIGKSSIDKELAELTGKKVGDLTFEYVGEIAEGQELPHILFIADSATVDLKEVLQLTKNKPVLTVSTSPEATEMGSIVYLYLKENKLRFYIDIENLKEADIHFSSRVLQLSQKE